MGGTVLGVPIVRTISFWGLYGVPLFRETTISAPLPQPKLSTHNLLKSCDLHLQVT